MSLKDQFAADAAASPQVTNSDLEQVTLLAEQQLHYETLIETLEADIADAKAKLKDVAERALPEAMASIGMEKFRLSNGYEVSIKDGVAASMKAEKVYEACSWLEGIGLGDVIKDEIRISLGRGEVENAAEFLLLAEKFGIGATEKLAVHPQTLNALVREQMEKGVEFPAELFSVYTWRKSTVKVAKEKVKRVKGTQIPVAVSPPVDNGPLSYEEF